MFSLRCITNEFEEDIMNIYVNMIEPLVQEHFVATFKPDP